MVILNFISWIKGSRVVTSVNPTQTLIPVGLKDNRRDDGYLAGAITVQDLAAQIGSGAIPVLNTYPVTTPSEAGNTFLYRGNEWHYMTQAEIDSIGWTGLVSVGFPAPVSKVYENTILYVGTDIPATDISFKFANSFPIRPLDVGGKIFTIDFLGLGNPTKCSVFSNITSPEFPIITFRNVQLLAGLRDFGTTSAFISNFTSLTTQALNDFFTALPPTTVTATLNFQNNPGSATCTPSIATSKGYTVIV